MCPSLKKNPSDYVNHRIIFVYGFKGTLRYLDQNIQNIQFTYFVYLRITLPNVSKNV